MYASRSSLSVLLEMFNYDYLMYQYNFHIYLIILSCTFISNYLLSTVSLFSVIVFTNPLNLLIPFRCQPRNISCLFSSLIYLGCNSFLANLWFKFIYLLKSSTWFSSISITRYSLVTVNMSEMALLYAL